MKIKDLRLVMSNHTIVISWRYAGEFITKEFYAGPLSKELQELGELEILSLVATDRRRIEILASY